MNVAVKAQLLQAVGRLIDYVAKHMQLRCKRLNFLKKSA